MEPVMSMMAKRTKNAPTISTKLIILIGVYILTIGLKYFCNGLSGAVEDDAVALFLAFESHVDGRLGTDGEEGFLGYVLGGIVRDEEFPGSDAKEEVLTVGDDDGTVFGGLEGGVVEEFLQDPNACICIGELFGIHVARAHHFCTIGVVAVDVGSVFVALLLCRLHFLLGGGSQLLLLFKAGSDDLYAPLLPGHVSRFCILEVINTKK